jgi:sec-independent protein translocase protein TatA
MIGDIFTPTHILLVLAVALIVLGPKRIPETARGLGSAIRGFKESLSASEIADERSAIRSAGESDRASDASASDRSTVSRPADGDAR